MTKENPTTNSYLRTASLEGHAPDHALKFLAEIVNHSMDHADKEAANHAVKLATPLLTKMMPIGHRPLIHYFISNAWSTVHRCNLMAKGTNWMWKNEGLDQQILSLRRSIADVEFSKLHRSQRARIFTNLGNALSEIGRPVEAIEAYDDALRAESTFAMALANKARAFHHYALAHHDRGQQEILLAHALSLYSTGLKGEIESNAARQNFESGRKQISAMDFDPGAAILHSQRPHSLGDSKPEIDFRTWALRNKLFLNPLNDLGMLEIASHDPLGLPPITRPVNSGPRYHGLFNQLKQEYASARYILYEGSTAKGPHFSDRKNALIDTLDYPSYSLNTEKLKIAIRVAYSLLDKIAFFVNDYFELKVPYSSVSFGSIWHQNGKSKESLNPIFIDKENWPLRGLYWLSRDAVDPKVREALPIEPDAKRIRDLRHALGACPSNG